MAESYNACSSCRPRLLVLHSNQHMLTHASRHAPMSSYDMMLPASHCSSLTMGHTRSWNGKTSTTLRHCLLTGSSLPTLSSPRPDSAGDPASRPHLAPVRQHLPPLHLLPPSHNPPTLDLPPLVASLVLGAASTGPGIWSSSFPSRSLGGELCGGHIHFM